ncbi:hypothetical protein G4Y79_09160 [Phototrophicus methaneseepsis]|uniref:Adhesin domain-containing protein n=1 Tax=Phototrophicus methaneseepsis TaxID=2710758 RepID=A0A7S8IFA4_9CHLR|nr:hypothetical protein [Phototrophicus methaneseepsis]QPC84525.1 hypothetical protein G4Y79_09160 [Phototrophicus methaneseepsis]
MSENPNPEQETKEKRKRNGRTVEWQFDFAEVGESFKNMLGSLAGDQEVQHDTFVEAIDGAAHAEVEIGFSIGKGFIRALAPTSGNLLDADVYYIGEMEFTVEGDASKYVRLAQQTSKSPLTPIRQGFRAMADSKKLTWQVGLTPNIPLDLSIDGGIGPVEADLSGLTLNDLDVDSGVGTMNVTLPIQTAALHAEIDSGVGQLTVNVPEGAHGELDIKGGVGEVVIYVSRNTALMLTAKSGLGSIDVASGIHRITGGREFIEDSGEWRTEGYELAGNRLRIKYDGGVGSFQIAYHESA